MRLDKFDSDAVCSRINARSDKMDLFKKKQFDK